MKIFVTGGTGFIGKHLVKKLSLEGHELLVLSRHKINPERNVAFVRGDLGRIREWGSEVRKFKPLKAIHLAWTDLPDYSYETSKKNLFYGLELYEFLASIGCRGIFTTGSCWEYGVVTGRLSEDMPIGPLNAFSAAKNALNHLGSELAKEQDMQFVWVRIFFAYGAGQREKALIPRLINYARGGEKPAIFDPATNLDFIYVEDIAEAIVKLIKDKDTSGTYNIGSGHLISVEDIVSLVGEKFSLKEKFSKLITKRNKGVASLHSGYWADISKIKKAVGWTPKTSLVKGIKKTLIVTS